MSSETIRHPRAAALAVANAIIARLAPHSERIEIAGSIRRLKPDVKDIEIVYVTRWMERVPPGSLFAESARAVDICLSDMLDEGLITRRKNTLGAQTWGTKIKYAVHHSGIPIDFFATTIPDWYSYLICRTGSAEHNIRLAARAQAMGYKWLPYEGLETDDDFIRPESEKHLYDLLKLPYLEPWERKE